MLTTTTTHDLFACNCAECVAAYYRERELAELEAADLDARLEAEYEAELEDRHHRDREPLPERF